MRETDNDGQLLYRKVHGDDRLTEMYTGPTGLCGYVNLQWCRETERERISRIWGHDVNLHSSFFFYFWMITITSWYNLVKSIRLWLIARHNNAECVFLGVYKVCHFHYTHKTSLSVQFVNFFFLNSGDFEIQKGTFYITNFIIIIQTWRYKPIKLYI